MEKLTDIQIQEACDEAYLKAGHNAYFANGFSAGVKFAESFNVANETGKTPRPLYDENKMLLEALKYCNDGLDYFFSKLNFGASFLDAKAITYMNKFPLKIKEAINKTTL